MCPAPYGTAAQPTRRLSGSHTSQQAARNTRLQEAGARRACFSWFLWLKKNYLPQTNKISTINFTIIHKFAARKITKNKNKNAQNMTNRPNCIP
jgi:hypothetical protein